MNIFRMKAISAIKANNQELNKTLSAFDLLLLGIGGVIGTGIFVLTGTASKYTGPALPISFLLSGLACMFVALAYTEIGSMIPTSGSVYTYSYLALGEIVAWLTGWLIILEFGVGATTVAAGWSAYVVDILKQANIIIPPSLATVPSKGGIINLPAIIISLLITALLVKGTKESALLNNILVVVKLAAITIFVIVAIPNFKLSNWDNFAPFGFSGIATGAAVVFLAFTGFDSLAAAAEECKNPKRDMTIGLIGSLIVCMILYMIVAAMLTGIVPFTELIGNEKPLAHALRLNGSQIGSALVAAGGIAGMSTVIIVNIFALSRVFLVMSRDGLLPSFFGNLHHKYNTPYISTIIIGLGVALVAGLVPIDIISNLASMGTLTVFILASLIVMILRYNQPELERPFKCPAVYLVGTLAILMCGFLFFKLMSVVGQYFLLWLIIGLVIYFTYSFKNSKLTLIKR